MKQNDPHDPSEDAKWHNRVTDYDVDTPNSRRHDKPPGYGLALAMVITGVAIVVLVVVWWLL